MVATPSTSGTFTANLNSNAATLTGAPSATNYTSQSSVVAYDDLGNPVTLNTDFSKTGVKTWQVNVYNAASPATPLTTQTLTFDPTTGNLAPPSPTALSIAVPGGNTVSLNIASMTQLASPFSVSTATMDGNAPSEVQSVSMERMAHFPTSKRTARRFQPIRSRSTMSSARITLPILPATYFKSVPSLAASLSEPGDWCFRNHSILRA